MNYFRGNGFLLEFPHNMDQANFYEYLNNFISDGFKISYIAKLLGVSERTIYRRMQQFNLYVENFSGLKWILVYRNVVGHIHGLTLVAVLDQIVYCYMHFAASSYLTYAVQYFHFVYDVLFLEVGKTVKEFPFCGENMIMQLLKQRGFRVQRWRLRDALYTLDETGIQERKKM
jgi:hypothetical protein